MRKGGNLGIGLILVVIGVLFLMDTLDVVDSDIPGDYWPVILIAIGVWGWLSRGFRPHFCSVLLMTLGGMFLAQNLVDDISFGDLWPVLVIVIGVSFVLAPGRRWGRKRRHRQWGRNWQRSGQKTGSVHDTDELFSDSERQIEGEYTGSTASVRLAGGILDLTRATLPPEGATLDLDVTLGGYKIRIPADWQLDIRADVTFGELEDKRPTPSETRTGPTLTIEGRVFMGGVEITD